MYKEKNFITPSDLKDLNISVVIPNYNGVHLFPETLPALIKALERSAKKYEIIIVDDCSSDDSPEYIKTEYPEITLIENEQNAGFASTINRGIFLANHELILLLNSDVQLTETYFDSQFRYFERPDTFGVMGKIIGWGDDELQDAAKYPKWQGFKLKTSWNYILDGATNNWLFSMYLSGANALVKRDHLLKLKGFDEIYSPFYMEDVDLSVRAWRIGLKCYFEPLSVCRHKTSSSISSKEKKKRIRTIYNRNKLYFHSIHLQGWQFAGWCMQTLLELLFRLLTLRTDYLLSCCSLIKNWKTVRRSEARFKHLQDALAERHSLQSIVKLIHNTTAINKARFFRS